MSRVVDWLLYHENRMFSWVHRTNGRTLWGRFMNAITHLGGATITIAVTLCFILFAPKPWNITGFHSLIALAISHVPVSLIKKKYPRIRPYLVFPNIRTIKNPLRDHSFPSGHSTAIFSVILPFVVVAPWLSAPLIGLALIVAFSRIYLGLHYPSDCLAGSLIGSTAALLVVLFMG